MGNGMNKVLPGLFIGNFRDSKDPEQLKENNITHILSIHDNAKKLHMDKEYLCIVASDSPGQNLTQFFPICNDFIHAARLSGGNVLIHCLAGVSRSVTVAVAYLMAITTLSWRDSLNAVRGARNIANPNFGFQRQLHDYETDKINEERRRMREKFSFNPFSDEEECRKLIVAYHCASHLNEPGEVAGRRTAQASYRMQASRNLKDRSRTQSPSRGKSTRSPVSSPHLP